MKDGLKLSVVIPAKNAEGTIGRAIASIRNQTSKPHEVIVVDNGSSDLTAQRAAESADQISVRVVACDRPGSAAARNTGINAATGNLIAFLDADDVWYPNKVEMQLRKLSSQSSLFCGTFMHYLSPSGRVLGNNVRFRDESSAAQALRSGKAMPVPLSSIMLSRSLIDKAGLFNEAFRRAQDLEWLTRVAKHEDLTIAGRQPLVGYVLQSGSSSDDAYIEQGLAADAVRKALKSNMEPNYRTDVEQRLRSGRVPRKYSAGRHYRRAGALIGESKYVRGSAELLLSAVIDMPGTISKLRWQSVGRDAGTLDSETRRLFDQAKRTDV